MKTKSSYLSMLLALVLIASSLLAGCSGANPTKVAAVATEAAAAAKAAEATPVPSNTPAPTSTNTPVPTDTPTATATVTRTATPNRTATQAVKLTATQAALDKAVSAELAKYNIDATLGHVVWAMQDPVELDGGGYAQGFYDEIKELGVLQDFVVQSEVTWDTSGGLAGCGYIFRAPKDWDTEVGDFYAFNMMRIANAPVWLIDYYEDGHWKYSLPGGRGVTSANIDDGKMSKNIVTLDVKGSNLTVYINGKKERMIDNNKIAEGRLAFMVIQNSGTSYCKFSNGWVWAYDE